MKPGWKTSECWLTMAMHMITAFLASGMLPDTHWTMKLAAVVSSGFAQFGYTNGRTKLKLSAGEKGHAKHK